MTAVSDASASSRPETAPVASPERVLDTIYPSIAAGGLGRMLGMVLNCLPVKVGRVRISVLLFALPLAPLGLMVYLLTKVIGQRYRVTNQFVSVQTVLFGKPIQRVALSDVADVRLEQRPGQAFYKAADVVLLNAEGAEVLRCPGVCRPESLRRLILKTREARLWAFESLSVIERRTRVAS